MHSCKYINVRKVSQTWESLLIAADSDFVSYLVLTYYNLEMATSLWMSQQAVEKYMKCFIFKNDASINLRKIYGHNLIKLWEEVKSKCPSIPSILEFDDFITELSTVTEDSRYSFSIDMEKILFPGILIKFCDEIRKIILGSDYKSRGFHGIGNFIHPNDVREIVCPIILTYGRSLRNK